MIATLIDWVPIIFIAVMAVGLSWRFAKSNMRWFAGAPLAASVTTLAFWVISVALPQQDPFIYVALIFTFLYALGLALIPYAVNAAIKWRERLRSSD